MKNLFNYSTKELSQDAFLRWLFENYNCENESVRLACRRLFDSFTAVDGKESLDFDKITWLETEAQWKKIDISIRFKIDANDYLIVIEDKTESAEHNQLENYNKQIQKNAANNLRVFKIYYKTNMIDPDERLRVEKQGWHIYDIFDIKQLFSGIKATSEVLAYYIESVNYIYNSCNRKMAPDEWNLSAWHSFFNAYEPIPLMSDYKEIACYQKAYFYMKLFVKDHLTDMPCLEIRSRDFECIDGKYIFTVRVVLYNLEKQASREMIEAWQEALKQVNGFEPSFRADVSKHKQIGKIVCAVDNTETSLIDTLDEVSQALMFLAHYRSIVN